MRTMTPPYGPQPEGSAPAYAVGVGYDTLPRYAVGTPIPYDCVSSQEDLKLAAKEQAIRAKQAQEAFRSLPLQPVVDAWHVIGAFGFALLPFALMFAVLVAVLP